MRRATIHMPLLNRAAGASRPVEAEAHADGRYTILGPVPDGEEWAFSPGAIVRGETRRLSDGREAVVAAPIAL
jgi:hypothetical protein